VRKSRIKATLAVRGEVAEWFKAAVLKTAEPLRVPWVQIPPSPNPATGSRRFDLRAASSERAQGLQKLCSPFHFELLRLKAVVSTNLLHLSHQAVPGGPTLRSGLGPSFLPIAERRAFVLQSLCENATLSRSQKRSTDRRAKVPCGQCPDRPATQSFGGSGGSG
jgi:hypothetical protein